MNSSFLNKKAPYIKSGDTIGMLAPAGKVDKNKTLRAKSILESQGFNVKLGKHTFGNHTVYSGTDEERISDLQTFLDDKSIQMILCARGGYGSARIIEKLDFTNFVKSPKWFVGFSDITVFHAKLNQLGIQSVHGPMGVSFFEDFEQTEMYQSWINAVSKENYQLNADFHDLNKKGEVKAELIGGNLSILYSLRGTFLEPCWENKILFIEDLGEYFYHLDRMMMNLELGGVFNKIKGLIVGQFTDMKDGASSFGKNAYEIISEHISKYDIPVCFNFPVGHYEGNMSIRYGEMCELSVNENQTKLTIGL